MRLEINSHSYISSRKDNTNLIYFFAKIVFREMKTN